jgi:hypothetical protein
MVTKDEYLVDDDESRLPLLEPRLLVDLQLEQLDATDFLIVVYSTKGFPAVHNARNGGIGHFGYHLYWFSTKLVFRNDTVNQSVCFRG